MYPLLLYQQPCNHWGKGQEEYVMISLPLFSFSHDIISHRWHDVITPSAPLWLHFTPLCLHLHHYDIITPMYLVIYINPRYLLVKTLSLVFLKYTWGLAEHSLDSSSAFEETLLIFTTPITLELVLPWLGWKLIKQPSLALALQKLSVSQSRNKPAVGKPTFSRSWLWAGFEPAHALIKPPMWQWLCFLMKSFWGSSSHMELCVYNHIYWVWGLCFMVHIKIHFWY